MCILVDQRQTLWLPLATTIRERGGGGERGGRERGEGGRREEEVCACEREREIEKV